MNTLTRTLHPEVRIIDAKKGIVDYVASDETIDSYRELIRARGWRFTNFKRNSPFVDSHAYDTIDRLLGKVTDFRVEKDQLIERVQWAIDVPENQLAQVGWKMTEAGYLKAVSVGFYPIKSISANDGSQWAAELQSLGMADAGPLRRIFLEQEQIELSAVIIGANPNALAKAYKAEVLNDEDLESLGNLYVPHEDPPADAAIDPGNVAEATRQARDAFLNQLNSLINS